MTVEPNPLDAFRTLADDVPVLIWTHGRDGATDWANRAWRAFAAHEDGEAFDTAWEAIVHPDDLAVLPSAGARGEGPRELRLRRRGERDYARYVSRIARRADATGATVGWVGSAYAAETAPGDERASFRAIADALPTMTWTARADGTLEWTNARWRSYAGGERGDRVPVDPASLYHPDDREASVAAWRRSVERGEPFETTARLRDAAGRYRWFLMRANPVRDASGTILAWYGTNVDIDAERRAAQQLEFFARLGDELAGTLEIREMIDVATRLIVPAYADAAEIRLGTAAAPRFEPQVIAVPLRRGGAKRGVLEVRCERSGRAFAGEDIPFFTEVARRIVPALENAEAFDRERRVAHTFQEAALQPALPDVPGLVFDAIYEAGRSEALIGGDWFDAFRIPDGRVVVSVGDVAGSGLDAAVTMASVRQGIRMVSGVNPDPNVLLDAADRALRASSGERFVTAFVGVVDPVFGTMTWASAGHPPPLLRRSDGSVSMLRGVEPPLGLRGRVHEAAPSLDLARGDLLVLYTDGLTEASHDVIAGELRAVEAVGRLDEPYSAAEALYDDVLGQDPAGDDVAILTVGFERPLVEVAGRRRAHRWTFDARDATVAHRVRHAIADALAGVGADRDACATAEIVFGELIGNVVRYAPGPVDVVLDLSGDAPVLHVVDEGAGFEHNPKLPADQLSERGRGLFIVAALTEELYVSRRARGGSHARAVLYAPASTYFAEAVRGSGG